MGNNFFPKINMTEVVLNEATASTDCPKKVTADLIGAASGWLSDTNAKIWTGLTTSTSDGYKLTVSITGVGNTILAVNLKVAGGCVATATSNAMCIHAASMATGQSTVELVGMKVYSLTKKLYDVTTTVVATSGVSITKENWGMTLTIDCSAADTAAPCDAAAATGIGHGSSTAVWGWSNYQPKETSDKVYAGIPRFSKGDLLVYKGLGTSTGIASIACGTGKALLGASSLIAGAAVAFGAATLAF